MSGDLIERTTLFRVGTNHPKIGTKGYPWFCYSVEEANSLMDKVKSDGYVAKLYLVHKTTWEHRIA